ncbi:MAG TPA: cytochrome c peroxidase, partial [Acetobacteraceae bacterium]|nr:cytochrome c peroxidase [Acetobacteraceae bacterium]
ACASCHFHSGADMRTVNQLNPGGNVQPVGNTTFGNAAGKMADGTVAGPNIALSATDFPFHRLADPTDRQSAVVSDTNNVTGSQGVFASQLVDQPANNVAEQGMTCGSVANPVFSIAGGSGRLNTRQVTGRNTPSNINAVFNFRNFWDGRANNTFNGVNPFGLRATAADPTARVYTTDGTTATPQALQLNNMSAASQAVGPILSTVEMACQNETFAKLARSMMDAHVLQTQPVAATDSVFGSMPIGAIAAGGMGLTVTYRQLVEAAFQPAYWQDAHFYSINHVNGEISRVADGKAGYLIDELNFSMFFGLAIDAYERTLVSDKSPFDTNTMSGAAQEGMNLFVNNANCVACHDGPLFSKATTFRGDTSFESIERMQMAELGTALYDNGFYNIGVRPAFEDLGVGGLDPYGNPLSFTRQFVLAPGTTNIGVDRFTIYPCGLIIPFEPLHCNSVPPATTTRNQQIAVDGSFKAPSLRNVALTPPYFHNGGQKSLADVVAFYNRGGDRRSISGGDTSGTGALGRPVPTSAPVTSGMGGSNADLDVARLGLSSLQQAYIVEFLKALTDPRVACHMAPFDHPGLTIFNGQIAQDTKGDGNADDERSAIQAVGAGGYQHCSLLFDRLNSGDMFTASTAFNILRTQPAAQ